MKVITLCGSTKFKEEFIDVNKWLSLQGNLVISVGLFGQADHELISPEEKVLLDEVHMAKIDLADEIFVINVGEYVGNSTKREIEYAKSKGKKIRYYHLEKSDIFMWFYQYSLRKETDWNK